MNQQFRNVIYLSDRSGTGVWRCVWPLNSINCISSQLGIQADYSQTPIVDQNYYKGMNSITVQRWISPQQKDLFLKFFKPLMDGNFGWLIYEEDDLMFDGTLLDESKKEYIENKYGNLRSIGIPLYNRGRRAFEGKEVQTNIRDMLLNADFVTVTTDYIKEIYHDLYGIPLENIISVPNLLPKYLFGDRYDPELKIKQFQKFKAKPRIGIVSSLSHFNVDGTRIDKDGNAVRTVKQDDGSEKWINEKNEEVKFEDTEKITDDFDDVADLIRRTVDDFQYVCFGYCPPQIKDLADSKKIEVHGGSPIMNYPSVLEQLQLQAIIAPIKKMPFNYCKSFIKTMECSAIGIPLFATNCLPYSRVMKKDQLFDNQDQLEAMLKKLKFMSSGSYRGIIEDQWKWLNSPVHEGDFNLKNFWLEDNLNVYIDRFRMKQKAIRISIKSFEQQYKAKKEEEAKKLIVESQSGEAKITL